MFASLYGTLTGAISSNSAPSSTPSTPPAASRNSSSLDLGSPSTAQLPEPVQDSSDAPSQEEIAARSTFYRKLVDRNKHPESRLIKIRCQAVKEGPSREPAPEECCGEACGLECVTTMWWEEEKTWRDLHSDWRSIKARIAAEEEELRRAREEEEALGGPSVDISIESETEKEETEEDVMDQITKGWKG